MNHLNNPKVRFWIAIVMVVWCGAASIVYAKSGDMFYASFWLILGVINAFTAKSAKGELDDAAKRRG